MAGSENEREPSEGQDDAESGPTHERMASLPDETSLDGLPEVPSLPSLAPPADVVPEVSRLSETPRRLSVIDELRVTRTTVHEVGKVAERLSVLTLGLAHSRHVARQVLVSAVFGLLLALTVALVFAGGTVRLLLGILAGTCIAALAIFLMLRAVAKLSARFGTRSLPGSPWLWFGAMLAVTLAGTLAASRGLWEVTKLPDEAPRERPASAPEPPPTAKADAKRADARMTRGAHVRIPRGVLYAPPDFQSPDGQFDLIIHFHGNVEMVEQSVAAAKVNALVAVINVGDGSGVYTKEMQGAHAFDRLLTTIETHAKERLNLDSPQIGRIALAGWSAGFASVNEILGSRSRFDRVDAVLLMDSPHAKYASSNSTKVYAGSIEPYAAFARRAMAGQKLMIVTHSAIATEGYPSTTETTNALLSALSLEREEVSPAEASPPPVELPVVLRAFPSGERLWMQVTSRVKEGNFAVYGCTGDGKGDHIAHLAQMSVTVLPPLHERWK